MNSILGRISPGQWELGAPSSPTSVSAQGKTTCRGFAVVALVVVALGCAHASGSATGSVSNSAQAGEFSGVLGHLSLGTFEPGQTASVLSSRSVAGGRVICSGSATASLQVSALGATHASGSCSKAVFIRVTQVAVETVYEQTANANILVTQECAEVVYEQTADANLRVTQVAVEVVIEALPFITGQTRCSGSSLATVALTATARGRTAARGGISAATAIPVGARGFASAWGQATPTITRIGLIGQARASGTVQASISQSAEGRARAYGQVAGIGGGAGATVTIYATAVGQVNAWGQVPTGYLSVSAAGQVQSSGACLIGIAGSGPTCLTGNDDPGPQILNYVY
jgi:hypothetical protein